LQPLVNLAAGYGVRPISVSWLGGQLRWNLGKRWSLQAGYALAGGFLPNYLERRAESEGFLSGLGYAVGDTVSHLYHTHYTFGHAKYNAGKHVSLELGKAKQFWGDGYRSMILSDHASPAPYFKLTTTLGKFRYMNLWMHLRDISSSQTLSNARVKYSAMHALSYQITPKLNATLYEWVVWQNKDTLSRRGQLTPEVCDMSPHLRVHSCPPHGRQAGRVHPQHHDRSQCGQNEHRQQNAGRFGGHADQVHFGTPPRWTARIGVRPELNGVAVEATAAKFQTAIRSVVRPNVIGPPTVRKLCFLRRH
jgi:hypothetical protein